MSKAKAAKTLHLRNKLEAPGVWYFQSTYHFYGTPHVQSTDPSLMPAAGNAQHLCKSGLTHILPSTCIIRNMQPVLGVFWHCTFDIHCLSAIPGHVHCIASTLGKGSTKIRLNPCRVLQLSDVWGTKQNVSTWFKTLAQCMSRESVS